MFFFGCIIYLINVFPSPPPFYLQVKQISSHDRLSFFGLMVKPVQRFPQFILFLQVSSENPRVK